MHIDHAGVVRVAVLGTPGLITALLNASRDAFHRRSRTDRPGPGSDVHLSCTPTPWYFLKTYTWPSDSFIIFARGYFDGSRTLRPQDTSAPHNCCRSLSRITGGAVSHRNCPGSKCPGFSSITALVSKCLVPRFWCRSVLRPVPKCPRVS